MFVQHTTEGLGNDGARTQYALLQGFRAAQASITGHEAQHTDQPVSQVLTALMRHGGVYSLRIGGDDGSHGADSPLVHGDPETGLTAAQRAAFVSTVSTSAASYFQHLVNSSNGNGPPATPSRRALMSHIAFPGKRCERADPRGAGKPKSGRGIHLRGAVRRPRPHRRRCQPFRGADRHIPDNASPLIDLDSVYGPRSTLNTVTPNNCSARTVEFG